MPKLALAIGAAAAKVEAVEGFANYSGPTPPPGIYPAVIKQIALTQAKSGKDMFRAVIEFKAPKEDPRKKYNGYAIFHHLVLPESENDEHYGLQIGQVNRMLDAMSGNDQATRNVLWTGKADTDAAGKKITKIGKLDLTDKAGIPVLVSAKVETFKRKVLKNGKPVKDPKTGKELFEEQTNLRVNDLFPADDDRGQLSDEQEDQFEAEGVYDGADDGLLEEADLVDDSVDEAVVADDDSGLGDSADDGDAADAADDLGLEGSDSDLADIEEASAEADADDLGEELIAQEIPEETVEEVTETVPAAPARRRRSAF